MKWSNGHVPRVFLSPRKVDHVISVVLMVTAKGGNGGYVTWKWQLNVGRWWWLCQEVVVFM